MEHKISKEKLEELMQQSCASSAGILFAKMKTDVDFILALDIADGYSAEELSNMYADMLMSELAKQSFNLLEE